MIIILRFHKISLREKQRIYFHFFYVFKDDAILLTDIVILKLKKQIEIHVTNYSFASSPAFFSRPILEHYYTVQVGTDRYRRVVTCLLEEKS